MIKLLWIDDNLDHDLTEKRMALYMEDDLDPHFARDATEAYYRLRDEPFDVVIFDLRLPPGPDDMWNELREEGYWQYGVELLKKVTTGLDGAFANLANARLGVFSIEAPDSDHEIFQPPINLPSENFMKKTDAYYEEDFINFIRKVAQK
jgi:CheY-like chemotaxis protein